MTRVLVVDDKETNAYYLEVLLKGNGCQVQTARHGAEALTLARQSAPEVVISDLLMPIMDGYTLLRHWKADPQLKTVPFIVYTATYTEARDEQLALDLGADAFILKPAEPEEFIARLREVQARPAAAGPRPTAADQADETDLLKDYSQTLIRKLEERSLQLEETNRALQNDIVRRETAEAALRVSEERFRLLAKATNDAVWDWDMVHDTRWWSAGFANLFGHAYGEVTPNDASWADLIHPDDRERVLAERQHAIDGGHDAWSAGYRFRRADGSWADVEDRGHLIRDTSGRAVRMVGGLSDVSERMALEEQVRKSQRLEAVGQLTGGVAHDFNNLLTVVLGNAEALVERLEDDPEHHELARMIVDAAQRGSDLTRRLLAFARKQNLTPRAVDLNQLVTGIDPLLRRALGGNIEIEFIGGDTISALVDPAQLEHALLNLCVNARDAMPEGGRLTIETTTTDIVDGSAQQQQQSGRYAVLAVSDTGTGIAPEHLSRIFEPFFSTKAEGKGSGLGLAMVYGFAKQSGGHVTVGSEPGKSTTFRLYLPSASGTAEPLGRTDATPSGTGGSETILLVEDDDLVRDFAQAQLKALGYRVIAARGGQEALDILRNGETVDLLFTDVIMPGMGGRELVRHARALRPDLKVLFTSGYSGNAAEDTSADEIGSPTLGKPYRRAELARRVREALAQVGD